MYCRETISYLGYIDMCGPNGERFFSRHGQKLGIDFGNSGAKLGMVYTLPAELIWVCSFGRRRSLL